MTTPSPAQQATRRLNQQLNREAKWSIYLTLFYLVGWIVCAYFLPNGTGLLGFPLWFEMSCIFLPVLFTLISMAVLKAVYQDIDLDADTKETE